MNYTLSKYVVTAKPLLSSEVDRLIIHSTRTGANLSLSQKEWSNLYEGDINSLSSSTVNTLIENKAIVPEGTDELSEVLNENAENLKKTEKLFVAIQPTASCQLGCGYCGQTHSNNKLDKSKLDSFIERIDFNSRDMSINAIEVAWFGAEPLTGLSLIRYASKKIIKVAKKNSCTYTSRIITNGVQLTNYTAYELYSLGVESAEVTIDGLQDSHNVRRPKKNGSESFSRIYANLKSILNDQSCKIKINIRCNVDKDNQSDVIPLIDRLANESFNKRLNSLYFAPVHSWGNDAHLNSSSLEHFASLQVVWFIHMVKRGFKVNLMPTRVYSPCMVFKPNSELIDAYGDLFNCTEVSYVKRYEKLDESGRLHNIYSIGNIDTKTVEKSKYPFVNFFRDITSKGFSCEDCNILPVCGGKCPKQWYEGIPPCPPEKRNMEQRIAIQDFLRSNPNHKVVEYKKI